jgi:hypothetical protein
MRMDANMQSGVGGAGGYANGVVPVAPCSPVPYNVIVGVGGAAPRPGTDDPGNNSLGSSFTGDMSVTVSATGRTAGNRLAGGAGGTGFGTNTATGGRGGAAASGAGGGGGGGANGFGNSAAGANGRVLIEAV